MSVPSDAIYNSGTDAEVSVDGDNSSGHSRVNADPYVAIYAEHSAYSSLARSRVAADRSEERRHREYAASYHSVASVHEA